MSNYSIGIDYGTLSGRAVLLDLNTGKIVATAVKDYPHAIISDNFINGEKLPVDFKLQHPQDYLDVLYSVVPQVLKDANVSPDDVSGVCVDPPRAWDGIFHRQSENRFGNLESVLSTICRCDGRVVRCIVLGR